MNDTLPGASLAPTDAMQRAHMLRWISVIIDYSYPVMIKQVVLPRLGMVELDDSVVQDATAASARQLGIADAELGSRQFLAGKSLSIADLLLAPIVDYLMAFPDIQEKNRGTLELAALV